MQSRVRRGIVNSSYTGAWSARRDCEWSPCTVGSQPADHCCQVAQTNRCVVGLCESSFLPLEYSNIIEHSITRLTMEVAVNYRVVQNKQPMWSGNWCRVWVKKVAPPKTFCNIFTPVEHISMKFCQYVASLYLHIFANSRWFILIFNRMALIFLAVPIFFNVSSFKFHQVKSL